VDKLTNHSPDLTQRNIDKLAELFPAVITEATDDRGNLIHAVNFDLLKRELSDHVVDDRQESYQLGWPGKAEALQLAKTPIAKTLRPVREGSADFDTTQNLFIEGDNLDALKLLQESYLGKVKLIYIDPPYNTGNDFIYDDDFSETSLEYLAKSGQSDNAGVSLVANTESNGRFHSDWLSMIYPRLILARPLLSDDGCIVVSIDDAEFATLKFVMDEIFGPSNQLAVLVWDRNRKNDAKYFSVGHEYMIIYAKKKAVLTESGVRFRERQAGFAEAKEFYEGLAATHGDNWDVIRDGWRKYCAQFPDGDDRRKLGRFGKVGSRGPYRDDGDISWPGGGGPRFEVLHPVTGKAVKVPKGGWWFTKREGFDEALAAGKIVFGPDETTLPRQIRYLFESPGLVMNSVHYSYAQTAWADFQELMGGRVFDNPKNWKDLRRIVEYLTGPHDTILDFFAGSGSTAHAIIDLNIATRSDRKYILVQLAEVVPEKSVAAQAGYHNISEIARDRVKRVIKRARKDSGNEIEGIDFGFRMLRIDDTNFADVRRTPDELKQEELFSFTETVQAGRTGEDLLFEVLLRWGLELTMPVAVEEIDGREVFVVEDGALIACFTRDVSPALVDEIARRKPMRAVFLDAGFDSDADRLNVEDVFTELSPATEVKVI
jgi:adenine-specific DNA-methyltransferase